MSEHRRVLDLERLVLALDAIRGHRDISWRQVAREVGMSSTNLSRLVRLIGPPSADNLMALLVWANIHDLRPFILASAVPPERRTWLADVARNAEVTELA